MKHNELVREATQKIEAILKASPVKRAKLYIAVRLSYGFGRNFVDKIIEDYQELDLVEETDGVLTWRAKK